MKPLAFAHSRPRSPSNMNPTIATVIFVVNLIISGAVADDSYHPYTPPKPRQNALDDNQEYWYAVAEVELEEALGVAPNYNVARNVIIFLGDGMGVSTVTSARIYEGQQRGDTGEEGLLSFEQFPHLGLSKTYSVDYTVADSAATGTAYLCGSKTNTGVLGVDGRVIRGSCESMTNDTIVRSLARRAQDYGKRTGVVTSTRITHATPGAFYSHVPEREWECDAKIPSASYENCPFIKDIGLQLVEELPGREFNVIMGGGFQMLDPNPVATPGDEISFSCVRADNRSLWQEWLDAKQMEGKSAAFVRNKSQLDAVNLTTTQHLMGIFANSHIPYEYEKIELGLDLPTLSEMTEAAITLLSQEPNGFVLLVEGGRIDHAHHVSRARASLDETVAMHHAINKALELTDQEETLIVVTADHSHTMTVSGYGSRETSILGTADIGLDLLPYTTLSYANGPGYNFTVKNDRARRGDLRGVNTTAWDFNQQTTIPRTSATHGGEDVAIYAIGPWSHLFHSVHQQNYIAHVMAFAACIDSTGSHCSSS